MIPKQTLLLVGILLIILGVALVMLFLAGSSQAKGKYAVVGFIGPIPFGTGNDSGLLKLTVILAAIAFIAFLAVAYLIPRLTR